MSLINDALKRASQTEKERPRHISSAAGMEPVQRTQGSGLNAILAVAVLIALVLAGWFFRQWWAARNSTAPAVVATGNPMPAVTPKPAPVVQSAPVNSTPASTPVPVAVTPTPVVAQPAPAPQVVTPPVAPPVTPAVVAAPPVAWPVDLTVTAIFYSAANPRAMINGNLYSVGDNIQGVTVKKIDRDQITFEWNGQTKTSMVEGQ